jgi:hypothetical protein
MNYPHSHCKLLKEGYLFIGFILFTSISSFSQYSRFIIELKDKNGGTASINKPSGFLSAKAIARRTKYSISIDSTDLPIPASYIDSIQAVPNVVVLNTSKWLNQVCIQTTDPVALIKINSFGFVKTSKAIAARQMQGAPPPNKFDDNILTPINNRIIHPNNFGRLNTVQDYYNYGINAAQIHIHEGEYLHNLGFHGEGITIAILDAGFYNFTINPAFDSVRLQNRVLGTWDYVQREPGVAEDHPHGAYCFSTIAANEPGQMVGSAPQASFWLLRTEDAATEFPVEEQNWVAAAEFADSAGVDMISSSLGYDSFDDPVFNHSYAQRDGKTAIITRGATLAVKKGILVTNSAGNSGASTTDSKYVICPADAATVLTIGATDPNGNIASFSSWGPNGAGLQKPDIVSVGGPAVIANATSGVPFYGNGTSYSNPNLCGLIACLWQAFPEFSNLQINDAVQRSSSKYTTPDNRYGFGLPNMRLAYEYLLKQRILKNAQLTLGNKWIKAFPVPFSSKLNVLIKAPVTGQCNLRLLDINGKTIEIKTVQLMQDAFYNIEFSNSVKISSGVYSIQYNDGKNNSTLKVIKQ